jgi:hypothetical protein
MQETILKNGRQYRSHPACIVAIRDGDVHTVQYSKVPVLSSTDVGAEGFQTIFYLVAQKIEYQL